MRSVCMYISVAILLSLNVSFATAQKAIQVASITREENFDWNENSKLFINGEQAEIVIETYSGSKLKCEIIRSSRHPNKVRAAEDLKKLKLLIDQSGRTIILRNYVELRGKDERPEAKLKTIYKIQVPAGARGSMEVWNYFGAVSVDGIGGDLKMKLEFSNLNLNNFLGTAELQMKYGEATLKNVSGEVNISSNRTNIEVANLSGSAKIEASYTELRLIKIKDAARLDVTAEKSEVFLDIPTNSQLGYEINTQNAEVNHLTDRTLKTIAETGKNSRYSYGTASGSARAEIKLNTGTLNYIVQ